MVEVFPQKTGLFIEGLSHRQGEIFQSVERALCVVESHRPVLRLFAGRDFWMLASIEATISSTVLNGP